MDKPASLFTPETQVSHDKSWTVFQISSQQVTTCVVIYLINSREIQVLNQTSEKTNKEKSLPAKAGDASLIPGREDPTFHGATEPTHHNCWAYVPQPLKPGCPEPLLCHSRSHCSEKPAQLNRRAAPARHGEGTPVRSNEDPAQPERRKEKF